MSRAASILLVTLALFLAVLPLGVTRPGMPGTLKADEPAYYLMALSLARDGDLVCDTGDLARLWDEFPAARTRNLILASGDGWHTVTFGKPYVYSLFAAPMVHLFGAGGMVSMNFLMIAAMIAMGAVYLRRFNSEWVAILFASGFFLLSTTTSYAFWLQPEVFNMCAVTTCLFLLLHRPGDEDPEASRSPKGRYLLRAFWAGAVLTLAAYNKPILALLGLPPWLFLLRRNGWRPAALFVAGAIALGGAQVGVSIGLTGQASAYLGVARVGVPVDSPDHLPVLPDQKAPGASDEILGAKNSWWWIFRLPEVDFGRLGEDLQSFFWGRHVGLLVYQPFAALACLLFLAWNRRRALAWGILASLVGVALFFFLWIPFNWHGGGGFVGNRYFLNAYPAFLFLVTVIRPRALLPLAWAVGGLFLGPLLLTPYGAPVSHPTLQAHTRNFPFDHLPLELDLLGLIPGYQGVMHSNLYVLGRNDQLLPRADELWLQGGQRVELWLTAPEPLESLMIEVRNPVPDRPPSLSFGHQRWTMEEGLSVQQLELQPRKPDRQGERGPQYRLVVDHPTGRPTVYPGPGDSQLSFHLGSAIAILGPGKRLMADLYDLVWLACDGPSEVPAATDFEVAVRLRNDSETAWPALGVARVALSYHWRRPNGETVDWEGRRTPLAGDVQAGQELATSLTVEAPSRPGTYVLELDPVFERVAWFSTRNGGKTCTLEVAIGPPEEATEEP